MPTELEKCPQRKELISYLLGKLPSEDSSICEAHIAKCDPCVQTIRSIDVSDTLTDLALNGLRNSTGTTDQESSVIQQLIGEIQDWTASDPQRSDTNSTACQNVSDSDLEDRAAEVQHFFEPAPDPESIGIVGKYRIVELLGAGSSGVVYRAIDTQLGRNVAVKFLRPSLGAAARQRFLTEAKAAAVINHPNVVQIYEVGMEDKLAFLAMQCVPGQTLEQRLQEQSALGNEETRKIGKQIADGIAAAHQSGIVHRDIKPANIWICSQTDNVTILDFGLARILEEDPQLTCTGLIAGTPCFMSPEQTRGRDIDRRSDFFSLGCLLYQCSTGVLPFKSENVLATLQSIQLLTPPTPRELEPDVDPELSMLVMTLLEKSPLNRPDQAKDIAAAFATTVSDWKFDPAQTSQPTRKASLNASQKNKVLAPSTGRWWPSIVAIVILGFILAGSFLMPQIIRVATNQGQLVIESNDPDVQVEILKGGERIEIVDLKTKQKLNIVAGEYQIRPMGNANEILIDKQTLTIRRGKDEIVKVTRDQNSALESTASDSTLTTKPKSELYLLDSGDILGVFVEAVLGEIDKAPPVMMPPAGSGLPPSVGFPIAVDQGGTISLPLIPDLMVRGKSIKEVKNELEKAFKTGDQPILRPAARIMVSLARTRGYVPPAASGVQQSVAMAAAQLGAAEAEYGEDHPFVERLRRNLDTLLGSNEGSSVSAADNLSIARRSVLDSEPTFNGITYAQSYKIAKYERNPKVAWSAIQGILELVDDNNNEKTIQTCLEFFRRTRFSYQNEVRGVLGRMAWLLDAETLESMLMSEIENGNPQSQRIMVEVICSIMSNKEKQKEIFEIRSKEKAVTIIDLVIAEKLNSNLAAQLLYSIETHTDLDVSTFENLESVLAAALSDSEIGSPHKHLIEFAMESTNNSPEIVKAAYGLVQAPGSSSTFDFTVAKLTALTPDQLKYIVPMIPDHHEYKLLKEQKISLTHCKEVFDLIAACGEHARALKDDFEQFEKWNLSGSSYLKARQAVLGE